MGRWTLAMLCVAALLAGCATNTPVGTPPTGGVPASSGVVPDGFRLACGQPGARVTVLAVPVTVAHAACDLVGVELTYGLASAVVPGHGQVEAHVETFVATTAPLRIVITVADGTGDVTVTG